MPAKKQYLVRLTDGTVRTIVAHSLRGAAINFVVEYRLERGEQFAVKERGVKLDGWQWYARTKVGIRELND